MILYESYTDTGGRPHNEDTVKSYRTDGDHLCTVLADGLGGHGGGKTASGEAVNLILNGWRGTSTQDTLRELVQMAHNKVLSLQTPACKMKTTVVVLAVEDGQAKWAHVGDSRLYHFKDGKLVFQTRDHSASQVAVMMGEIRPEQIRFHEDRSRIFRALGQESSLTVDTREEILEPGEHAFLLCSDGFWEYVYEEEMERELSASASPREWLDRMKGILAGRVDGTNDNNTAAAIWLAV